jgi:TRAP-type transport system periplasmic protein
MTVPSRMTRRRVLTATAASLAAPSLLAQQRFTMKMGTPGVEDVGVAWMRAVKAGVESRSNGRIRVEIYPANQLGPLPRVVEGVALGTVEFALPAAGFVTGLEPRFMVLDSPGLFDDIAHAQRVLTDPAIRKRLSAYGSGKGIEPLSVFAYSPLTLLSHKPVRTLGDLKGMKLRVPGAAALHIEPIKHFGGVPVSVPPSDMLPALQNRTLDGLVGSPFIWIPNKYYDVAKHQTYLPGSYLMAAGIANRNWLKSLGPELEAIVREEAHKADALISTQGVSDTQKAIGVWESNGGTNHFFSKADATQYFKEVGTVAERVSNADPVLKDEFAVLSEAARRHRQPS